MVEELIFNHSLQIKKLNQFLQKSDQFVPGSTAEKVFGKPMPGRLIRSAIFVKMFEGYSQMEPENSDDQRMRDIDEALENEGIFGQKVEEMEEFEGNSVMALGDGNSYVTSRTTSAKK